MLCPNGDRHSEVCTILFSTRGLILVRENAELAFDLLRIRQLSIALSPIDKLLSSMLSTAYHRSESTRRCLLDESNMPNNYLIVSGVCQPYYWISLIDSGYDVRPKSALFLQPGK